MEETPIVQTQKPKRNKRWIAVLIAAVLLIGGVAGYMQHEEQERIEAERKAAAAKKKKIERYGNDIQAAAESMISTGSAAESMINQYYTVWRKAIYDDRVEINGEIAYDFNKAIQLQHDAFEAGTELSELQVGVLSVASQMKELNSPPAKYEQSY